MTLQEFKAWFEGYTESLGSTPNEKQWKRIKARVAEIDGQVTAVHHWHEYWRGYLWAQPYYQQWNTSCPQYMQAQAQLGGQARGLSEYNGCNQLSATQWASALNPFNALGRADSASDLN